MMDMSHHPPGMENCLLGLGGNSRFSNTERGGIFHSLIPPPFQPPPSKGYNFSAKQRGKQKEKGGSGPNIMNKEESRVPTKRPSSSSSLPAAAASKKRASSGQSLQASKKRVPLGDITNRRTRKRRRDSVKDSGKRVAVEPSLVGSVLEDTHEPECEVEKWNRSRQENSGINESTLDSVSEDARKPRFAVEKGNQSHQENSVAAESTQDSVFHDAQKPKCEVEEGDQSQPENSGDSESTRGSDSEDTQEPKCELRDANRSNLQTTPILTASNRNSELTACSHSSSIYEYLHTLEEKRRALANYMEEVQNDISAIMREILVDWLVEVGEEYKLVSDTLYLTVSYLDRYLSFHALGRNRLQLLGVSCMLIASKYEEICPPHIEDFCYISDNTYTKEEVIQMEKDILKVLDYEVSTPTAKNFLRILTKAAKENREYPDKQFEFLSCYLAELSLLEHECVRFLPSTIAASAVFLSRFTIQPKMHPWSTKLQCFSGYRPSDLKECVLALHSLQLNRKGSSLKAVRDKYMSSKFAFVAKLSPPSEIPAKYFEATG